MECDLDARYIHESLWIRQRETKIMNRDKGAYFLIHVYKTVGLLLKPTLVLL